MDIFWNNTIAMASHVHNRGKRPNKPIRNLIGELNFSNHAAQSTGIRVIEVTTEIPSNWLRKRREFVRLNQTN